MPKVKKIPDFTYTLFFIVILAVLWQIAVNVDLINPFYLSSPQLILRDFYILIVEGEIWEHLFITVGLSLIGLLFGILGGVITALLFLIAPPLRKVFDSIMVGLNGVPKLTLGPIFIIWFGIGNFAKVAMSFITVFFIIFFNVYEGFRSVDVDLIKTLKIMGASRWQIIRKVLLPGCIPWIFASLRPAAGAAIMGTIVGEYLGSSSGLGWMVQYAGGLFNLTRVLSVNIVLLIIMSLADYLIRLIQKRALKWRESYEE